MESAGSTRVGRLQGPGGDPPRSHFQALGLSCGPSGAGSTQLSVLDTGQGRLPPILSGGRFYTLAGSRQFTTCAEPSSCPERVLGRRLKPRAHRPRRSHRWAHGTHVPQGRYKATCGGACVLSPAVIIRQPAAPQASTLAVPELGPSVMSSHSTNMGPEKSRLRTGGSEMRAPRPF